MVLVTTLSKIEKLKDEKETHGHHGQVFTSLNLLLRVDR